MTSSLLLGFDSIAEEWNADYEEESFEEIVDNLYEEVRPLHVQLHAYVRRKLREVPHIG